MVAPSHRIELDGEREDTLFRIFDHCQGLERRALRIMGRRHFNVHAIDEMRSQAQGLACEIETLLSGV